jgi:UDP:flavonoid glycosyltransferase YjiC (YdhE family)
MSGAAAGVLLSAQLGRVAANGVASVRAESKSKLRNFMRQSPDKGRPPSGPAQEWQKRLPQASKAGFLAE